MQTGFPASEPLWNFPPQTHLAELGKKNASCLDYLIFFIKSFGNEKKINKEYAEIGKKVIIKLNDIAVDESAKEYKISPEFVRNIIGPDLYAKEHTKQEIVQIISDKMEGAKEATVQLDTFQRRIKNHDSFRDISQEEAQALIENAANGSVILRQNGDEIAYCMKDKDGKITSGKGLTTLTERDAVAVLKSQPIHTLVLRPSKSQPGEISFMVKVKDDDTHHYFLAYKEQSPVIQAKVDETPIKPADFGKKFNALAKRNNEAEERIAESGGYNDESVSNRFQDIPCPQGTQLQGHETVHANSVTVGGVHMILSQAPLPDNETDFWHAASENTYMILDLTNKADREEKGVQRYFPREVGDHSQLKGIDVACKSEEKAVAGEEKLKLHTYDVTVGDSESKSVARLHFRGWPDFGVIPVRELKTLVTYIRSSQNELSNKPLWIHCRAGVGRSGTVAVALALAKMKDENRLNESNYIKVIDDLIIEGRVQRGTSFVQTSSQYQLLHEFARDLLLE